MILLPYALISLCTITTVINSRAGILAIFFCRPIIECFWEAKYFLMGIRPPELAGSVFPSIVFFRILLSREQNIRESPLSILWMVYIFYHLFSFVIILTEGAGLKEAVNFFFRSFNGFIGYFALQEYFHDKKNFKRFLKVLILAGVFPLGMSFYQNILGGTLRVQETYEGIVRNIGLYHDALNYRMYAFQTIAICLLFIHYFLKEEKGVFKYILFIMILMGGLTIYKTYSKSAYLTGAIWLFLWNALKKNKFIMGAVVATIFIGLATGKIDVIQNFQKVFVAEIDVIEGDAAIERSLTGRWAGWSRSLQVWAEAPIHRKVIGLGNSGVGVHNDFLRALVATGIIGLVLYCILLASMGVLILKKWLQERSPLVLIAALIYIMWWTDALGLVPSSYPSYQWFSLGVIGLALRGVDGLPELEASREEAAREEI